MWSVVWRHNGRARGQKLQKSAYLIGAKVDELDRPSGSSNPLHEFHLYRTRNDVDIFDFGLIDSKGPSWFARRMPPEFQFAVCAAGVRDRYASSLASGESIGWPMAITDLFRRKRKPLCIVVHGSYFASWKWRAIASVLRRLRHVHWACLSSSLKRAMIEDFGFKENQVHNAGYGVDTTYFQPPAETRSDSRLVVSAGTASRDYRTLVSACRGLEVTLRIAVDSAWYRSAVDLGSEPLPSHWSAESAGNYAGLRDLYARAGVVVVPLHPVRHACGYAVIVEAMAMGKPVVATRTPAVSDFIEHGVNGFLVEPGDVEGLRRQIQVLVEDDELASRIGARARLDCVSQWSLEAYCERLEAIVDWIENQSATSGR